MVNEHLSAILLDKQAMFDKVWEPWIKYLSDPSLIVRDQTGSYYGVHFLLLGTLSSFPPLFLWITAFPIPVVLGR